MNEAHSDIRVAVALIDAPMEALREVREMLCRKFGVADLYAKANGKGKPNG